MFYNIASPQRMSLQGFTKISKGLQFLYVGWGGRDRTCECRHQKPVPYRLATPHPIDGFDISKAQKCPTAAAL
jgi:hypothetical protein